MLAGGLDVLYREALARPHLVALRVEVWRSGVRIDTYGDSPDRETRRAGLPILGGSVRCTQRICPG